MDFLTIFFGKISAINAKTIKVTFNKAVEDTSKATFTAKRDGAVVSFAKVTWNEAKTEAQLEVSYKLFAGKYAVTTKVGDVETVSPEFTVEDEKIAKINFASDKAVLNAAATEITSTIKIENQYGEDITKNYTEGSLKIVASRTDASTLPTLANGVIKVTAPSGQKFAVDEKVVVTVVDTAKGVTATQTLTCVASADIASIQVGDITTKETAKTIYVGTDLSTKDYWLPITVKDQYGNEITDLDTLKDNLTLLTSDKNIMDDFVNATDIVTKDNKPAIKLKDGNTTPAAKAGLVTVTIVSKSGKSVSKVVEVKEDAKTDVFTISQPEEIIKAGTAFVLPFTAVDQYGNALVKAEGGLTPGSAGSSLTLGSSPNATKIDVTNGTIAGSIDYKNDNKLVLKVTPTDADQKLVIVVTTPTAKVQTLTLNVQSAKTAKTISGLKSTFYTAIQDGQAQADVALTDIVSLKDQYGDDVTIGSNTLEIAAVDPANTNVAIASNASNYNFTATATKNGTAQFKVTLKEAVTNKVLDTYTFTMENVALKDVTQFAIKDMGKFYTGTAYINGNAKADYDKTLAFEGKKADGTKVLVDSTLVKGATSTAPIVLDTTGILAGTIKVINATDATDNAVDTANLDKTATITFTMEGAEGPVSVTKDMVYSSAKPVAQSLKVMDKVDTTKEITEAVVEEDAANLVSAKVLGTDTAFNFLAKDQYGVAAKNITYTVTNVKVHDGKATTIAIGNTGAITVTGDALVAGDSFVITASIDGLTKTLKVIVK